MICVKTLSVVFYTYHNISRMKTNFSLPARSLLCAWLLCLLLPVGLKAQQDSTLQRFTAVSGTVKDGNSRKALSQVSVSVAGSHIGTVTNADGYFLLKIDAKIQKGKILISDLGYKSLKIPFHGREIAETDYFLTPEEYVLPMAVVDGWKPTELVAEAVRKVGENYSQEACLLTGFYRETAQKGRRFINIAEAVLSIYKTSYPGDVMQDRVQVRKGRELLCTKPSDTLGVRILGGPNVSVYLDIVKNQEFLFNEETRSYLNFAFEEQVFIDERAHYVVRFSPNISLSYPLYHGRLYIDKKRLSFTRIEMHLDTSDPDKVTQHILRKKPASMRFKPEDIYTEVHYRTQDGKTYLNYIRNEIKFACDWRRRLFATRYTAISEMVVTDMLKGQVLPISRRLSFNESQSLSKTVGNFYDENFWEAYNIIEPSESLETAVGRLKRQSR